MIKYFYGDSINFKKQRIKLKSSNCYKTHWADSVPKINTNSMDNEFNVVRFPNKNR